MNTPTEVWKKIPGAAGLCLVSNLGHLKQLVSSTDDKYHDNMTPSVFDLSRKLWCSLRGAKLGWFLFVDEDNERFFERDRLMELFAGIPVKVDTSRDEAARELRKDLLLYCEAEIATRDECDVACDRM